MAVKNPENLVPVPDSLPLSVAALLPSGALTAYAAVMKAKSFVKYKLQQSSGKINTNGAITKANYINSSLLFW